MGSYSIVRAKIQSRGEIMSQDRQPRSDSISAQTDLQEALQNPIIPPIDLNADQRLIFDELIEGLPRMKWDKQSIRMVARLAKLELYMEEMIEDVLHEGAVLENARGTPITNPRQSALMSLTSTVKMLRNSLGLSASQRGISKGSSKPAQEQEAKSKAALKAVGGKKLLA